MSSVAIITARGGSKRIPYKNIKDFLGRPIISYSIEAALNSHLFNDVVVSTDDEKIAEISRQYGASVPFMRSAETSNDFADTTDVLKEVIQKLHEENKDYDTFCCIYPTAPFITAQKLIDSRKLLEDEDVYNVIPMTSFSFPPQRGMKKDGKYIIPVDKVAINARSQDLETIYHDCGQFYWCKTREFEKNPDMLSNHTVPYIVPEMEVQDIDNESDWKLAEIKYQFMRKM